MKEEMIMGNQAIALGALKAGVNLAAGYPGTPSSEIIEYIAKYREKTGTYVEWSVNEKAAVEVASGASYAGSRTLVTMKQVGLNVASDPVMCLAYVGVKGGMVIVSADDPGPISSQTEQDTRAFGPYSKIPVFDPSTPKEAYEMVQDAFELSEKYGTPVILRPTTRVDHAYESMEFPELPQARKKGEFEKDSQRWVIFPKASYNNHKKIFERNEKILPHEFSNSKWNHIENSGASEIAFAAGGISWCYLKEALSLLGIKNASILKVGNPYPFPVELAEKFLSENKKIVVFEELDPVIEGNLFTLVGKKHIECSISGKLDGLVPPAGELSVELIKEILTSLSGTNTSVPGLTRQSQSEERDSPVKPGNDNTVQGNDPAIHENEGVIQNNGGKVELPVRPPVLCAGCPHRAAFYAVKQAMKGEKTVYCGDIGCYTLGNAKPLDMCDTCLCMGADITQAQGFYHNENDRKCFSFIGDSTFFASGITGVVNAVYNQAHQTICVLDNSTTAMTGHQPHPGTGRTMMGEVTGKISIEKILSAIGVEPVITVNPFDQEEAVQAVKKAVSSQGVSAVIFKAPCIAVAAKLGWDKPLPLSVNQDKCIGCQKCIREIGCPALSIRQAGSKKVQIDSSLCTGCKLCSGLCPVSAIG